MATATPARRIRTAAVTPVTGREREASPDGADPGAGAVGADEALTSGEDEDADAGTPAIDGID